MSEQTLTRTRSVLTVMEELKGEVTFGSRREAELTDDGQVKPPEFAHPIIHVSRETWEELGSPTQLTISIWPGDRQDLMESDEFPA